MNFANYPELNDAELNDAIHYAVEQVRSGLNDFTTSMKYPNSVNNFYPLMDNTEGTNGYWTGVERRVLQADRPDACRKLLRPRQSQHRPGTSRPRFPVLPFLRCGL